MTKEENAFYTNIFLLDEESDRFNPRIMCATSRVGNAGIDSSKTGVVYQLGMPESVSNMLQEKGRAGRYPDALAVENCHVFCFSIEDHLY